MKKILAATFVSLLLTNLEAQVLFTYGEKKAEAADFLKAFNKNNTVTGSSREKAMREYLELYIQSRLRIEEAYRRRYDTLRHIQQEVANLRAQIIENYMSDPGAMDRMVLEAFNRSQKDIRLSQIFIAFQDHGGHVHREAADAKLNTVMARLKKGEDFRKLAAELSDDTSARSQGGDLGYITVFTLPYEIENIAYTTPVGRYSEPITSKAGYHIFKVTDQRKALGKIKAQQILLAFPPNVDAPNEARLARLADSLYRRIQAGDDFGKLASQFSNDYVTAANSGIMPEIGVGQYDPVFESSLWALAKDGAVSKPFRTSHGWHILRRISTRPVVTDVNNQANLSELRSTVLQDSRWKGAKDFIYDFVKKNVGFKRASYSEEAAWAFADSLLDGRPLQPLGKGMDRTTPLLTLADSVYTFHSFIEYANTYRYRSDGSGVKPHAQVRDEYENYVMMNYYRDHLEDFNADFRYQMNEFKDGNLFFEIMQTEIWNRAQADSAALMALYRTNPSKYIWERSMDAILVFCADEGAARMVHAEMKKDPANWRAIIAKYPQQVVADSSRFEPDQVPAFNASQVPGLTEPVINENDRSASFAYVIRVNDKPIQRSFAEAKGLLVNDYQLQLEEEWNKKLRERYPVMVNGKV